MTKQSRPDLGSKTPEIKTEKRKAVGGDCKESNIEGKSARKYSRRWDIIVTAFDFVTNFSESSISAYAGQAAFFLMLSFFPFLLFFFSLLSWTPLTVYIGAKGCADFLIGDYAAKHTISEGDMLVVPSKTLCGVTTETGCIYTEIIIKKENNNMNKIIKSGEVMKLKDLISYEDGSITNIDVVSNDTMKFVLMAFDEGTGLTPHRAPGNAIIFALEGKAVIDYEGKDYTISAGENFRFDKNGLHSVTADERFKMGLLLVLE